MMNDPFEGLLHKRRKLAHELLEEIRSFAKTASADFFRYFDKTELDIEGLMNEIRVKQLDRFSFGALSETYNNSLLWSHYADQHRGIVLGIDFELDHHFTKVQYVNELPEFDVIKWCKLFDKQEVDESGMVHMMIKDISYKSAVWSYEEEWRVWRMEPCYFHYSFEQVKEVIFGVRFDERYINLVAELAGRRGEITKIIARQGCPVLVIREVVNFPASITANLKRSAIIEINIKLTLLTVCY